MISSYKPAHWMPLTLTSPVSLVCHDAGAANLIFAWLSDWAKTGLLQQFEFNIMLQGPAEKIWHLNPVSLHKKQFHKELRSTLRGSKSLLTGTGWASTLEHDARRLAASLDITSIAVIDHWVNYSQRFERNGVVSMPNQIWVSDSYAASMATSIFNDITVIQLQNIYLKNLVNDISSVSKGNKNLLYVLEPIRNEWGRDSPGEFQCLDFFAKNISHFIEEESIRFLLRPHPSDYPGKYDAWMKNNAYLNPELDKNCSLSEAISNARWVAGAETFAMVVAVSAGRKTFSTLPPWAEKCRLPHPEIIHLRDYV